MQSKSRSIAARSARKGRRGAQPTLRVDHTLLIPLRADLSMRNGDQLAVAPQYTERCLERDRRAHGLHCVRSFRANTSERTSKRAAGAATLPVSRAHRPVPPACRAASPLLAMPPITTDALPARMEGKGAHPVNIVRQWLRQDARGFARITHDSDGTLLAEDGDKEVASGRRGTALTRRAGDSIPPRVAPGCATPPQFSSALSSTGLYVV